MLYKFTEIMEGLIINKNKMLDNINLSKGLIYSQRLMLTLIAAGMIREKAYRIVQESSNKAWNEGIELKELISINKDVTSILNNQEIQKVFDINYFLKNIDYKFKQSKLIKE